MSNRPCFQSLWLRVVGSVLMSVLGWLAATTSLAQENHPPSAPGEISVTEITAHSARIAWGAATDADGDALVYQVWLRKRIEGVAQPWLSPRDTRGTFLVWDGLSAATLYEVKVVASDGKAAGPARIREEAFTTLRDPVENHVPTTPRGIEVSAVAAHSARIAWGAATDADGDPISYFVSVRKRVEGVVSEWLAARTSTATSLVWEGLEAETVYDVRVRASDGKSVSPWFLKESAFRTQPEVSAPSKPGEITVSSVTAASAKIAWGAATGPAGVSLVYQVQVRARLEGVAQAWRQVAETTELSVSVTGLQPKTVYDVQVRAWAQSVAGAWMTKERAFVTLASTETNHPPTRPGPLEVSDLTPFSVRLSWRPSTDVDGDSVTYAVCLRARIAGVAQPWSTARETERPTSAWDGLAPKTLYEVRVRAWDGKAASDWYIKEQAFETPATSRFAGFARLGDRTAPDAQPTMQLVWPADSAAQGLETSDALGSWTPCLEVETDGTQNRAQMPMDGAARFFRVR